MSANQNSVIHGSLYMVGMVSCLACDAAIVRLVSSEMHPFEIAFFRNLLSLSVFGPWLFRVGLGGLRSPRLGIHLARAALKLIGLLGFLYAVKLLPLATVTAIGFAAPLFVSLGCIFFLDEKPHLRRLLMLIAGTIGVFIVFRPDPEAFGIGLVLAIASAVALGGSGMIVKYLAVREDPRTVVALNAVLIFPVTVVISIPVWTTPTVPVLGLLLLQGVFGGLSQLFYSRAMSLTDASIIAPLEFLRLPFVAVLAWVMFAEAPSVWAMVGGAVIFVATFASVEWERRAAISRDNLPLG